jgi:hypothetical protein
MENLSQNTPRTRGRPRKAESYWWDLVTTMEGRHTSHRHRANYLYGIRATTVLGDDPRFAWLRRERRSTLMDELGRIDDDADLRTMALYLCEHQPSTRQGVALLRTCRLGALPPGTSAGLTEALATAIETYLAMHTEMPRAVVHEALEELVTRYQAHRPRRRAPVPARRPLSARLAEYLEQTQHRA